MFFTKIRQNVIVSNSRLVNSFVVLKMNYKKIVKSLRSKKKNFRLLKTLRNFDKKVNY